MTSLFTAPTGGRTPDPSLAHRRADATVTLRGPDGAPLADQDVVVRQTRHAFLFGCIGFDLVDLAGGTSQDPAYDGRLADAWFDVFNQTTLPFYWGTFEPERGAPQTDRLLRAARWFADRGVVVKGHPLVWHTVQPDWLLGLPDAEVERLQRERVRRDVAAFRGVVDTWDAINEVVIMPVFTAQENAITPLARQKGRVEMIRMAFEEARAENPGATLLLNDFDLSTAYECLVEAVLGAGIRIDRLGLQSHMHQGYLGEERTLEILDRFSRYGIPIHFTETTLLSGDLMPGHIEDLNDWQVESWPSTPEGRSGRPTRSSGTTAPCCPTRPSRRRRTGGCPTVACGSTRPAACCGPTGRPSLPTTGCAAWSRTSGGWRRPPCAPTPRAGCGSAGSSVTTRSSASTAAVRGRSRWTPRGPSRWRGSSRTPRDAAAGAPDVRRPRAGRWR
nr:hypothetical protein GCM10025730_08040 [Promicromonospora thailandica]